MSFLLFSTVCFQRSRKANYKRRYQTKKLKNNSDEVVTLLSVWIEREFVMSLFHTSEAKQSSKKMNIIIILTIITMVSLITIVIIISLIIKNIIIIIIISSLSPAGTPQGFVVLCCRRSWRC